MTPTAMSAPSVVLHRAIMLAGTHTPCLSGLIDNAKSRMLLYLRDSQDWRAGEASSRLKLGRLKVWVRTSEHFKPSAFPSALDHARLAYSSRRSMPWI